MFARRHLLHLSAAGALAACTTPSNQLGATPEEPLSPMATGSFPVTRTDAEWRALLTPAQYRVLRTGWTPPQYSHPGWNDYTPGSFTCQGCGQPNFDNAWKFDAGIGYPNFHTAVPGSVGTRPDPSLPGPPRTALHCARCGSHNGHLFMDGPTAARTRYCMDDLALRFLPKTA
jgi:peptide-methionine (R)-S-oxide reductase